MCQNCCQKKTHFRIQYKWNRSICILVFLFVAIFGYPHCPEASETVLPTRAVIDRSGRKVRIPVMPKRIACIHGPSYEKLFALGAADRVAIVTSAMPPWNYKLNPDLPEIPVLKNFTAVDVELLLRLKIDLVIYHPFAGQIARMNGAGLPVVVPYDGSLR